MSRLTEQLTELGIEVDAQLFELAYTHRSYAYENGRIPSNERLEFLGDAVLQIIVTEHIYLTYPELQEGQLAKLRASVVSSNALAEVARELGLGEHLLLGRGELATDGANKSSILADTMEAVIGAVHLGSGRQAASDFVHSILEQRIADSAADGHFTDFKTVLQELCAQHGWEPPTYQLTGTGPDHKRLFTAQVIVNGRAMGSGEAPSKKRAEQRAARQACEQLSESPNA